MDRTVISSALLGIVGGLFTLSIPATAQTPPTTDNRSTLVLLTCAGNGVVGGTPLSCQAWLTAPASQDTELGVRLLGDSGAVQSPPALTFRTGERARHFQIATKPVAAATPITISLSHAGQVLAATRTVMPPSVKAFNIEKPQIAGGAVTRARITLTGPAPEQGLRVHLHSSDPDAVSVPDPFVIPANTDTATFEIRAKTVEQSRLSMLTASVPGSADAPLTAPLFVGRDAKPDLTVFRWSFRDQGGASLAAPPHSAPFEMCVDVRNQGLAVADGSRLRLIVLTSDQGRNLELEQRIAPLEANASAAPCFGLPALDAGFNYAFNLYADYEDAITESDEANNHRVFKHRFAPPTNTNQTPAPMRYEMPPKQESI